ncbi:MAG: hypothetical protein LBJ61_00790 [Deltaproteobacteria bacterium]|jgi:hypothetical protein|nr:hypothetical protein [Deltaproteobacteria bacterium]
MKLFKGLAIEEKLGGEKIAPRPVINLDMSSVTIRKGADYFVKSLGRKTAEIARLLKVGVPKRLAPEEIFSS